MTLRELALLGYGSVFVALLSGLFWRAIVIRQLLNEVKNGGLKNPRPTGLFQRQRTLRLIANSLEELPTKAKDLYIKHQLITGWCIVLFILVATFPFLAHRIPA